MPDEPATPVAQQPSRLRADARRNRESIRIAALDVFRTSGLTTSLDVVAQAAGVSTGTIYHRFGTRQGLIEVVVDDLVSERLNGIFAEVELLTDPTERIERYLWLTWMLQYDEPAANDVLTRMLPESQHLSAMCNRADRFGQSLLRDAQAAGTIALDVTAADLYELIWERGTLLRAGSRPTLEDYQRRLRQLLRGLRR